MTPYLIRNVGKAFALLLFVAAMATSVNAQDSAVVLSADSAVRYAMKHSAQVKNALLNIDLQRQQNREITAAAYPQLTGSVSGTYFPNVAVQQFPNFIAAGTYGVLQQEGVKNGSGQTIVPPNDFGFIQAQFGSKFNANLGIDLSQLLFDGQVFVGLQARKTSMQWARKTAEVTQEQIKANVYKVYYQLVAGKQQISTIDANITRLEKLLHDTKEIYKNGFAEKLDVSKAEVSLTNLRTQKLKITNQLDAGYLGLKLLLGMPAAQQVILTDTLPEQLIGERELDAVYSYNDRVEYEQQLLTKKLNEYNIKRYKLSYIPTVSLTSSYYKNAQRNKFDFFNKGDWFTASSIGVRLDIPIFDGFAKDARIKQARIQLQQTENNIENLKLTIDKEVEEAKIGFRSAIASMDYQKKNMELAEEVYNQTKLKYEQGLGSNMEITTAQSELTTAQDNYYSALYDAIVARVDFLKATGKL